MEDGEPALAGLPQRVPDQETEETEPVEQQPEPVAREDPDARQGVMRGQDVGEARQRDNQSHRKACPLQGLHCAGN